MYTLRAFRPSRNMFFNSWYGRLVGFLTSGGYTRGLYPLACGIISEACSLSETPLLASFNTPMRFRARDRFRGIKEKGGSNV